MTGISGVGNIGISPDVGGGDWTTGTSCTAGSTIRGAGDLTTGSSGATGSTLGIGAGVVTDASGTASRTGAGDDVGTGTGTDVGDCGLGELSGTQALE